MLWEAILVILGITVPLGMASALVQHPNLSNVAWFGFGIFCAVACFSAAFYHRRRRLGQN